MNDSDLKNYMILKWNENKKEYNYFISSPTTYDYRTELIYIPTIKLEFEGKQYNAPKEYDYILNRIYGDYMELSPEEKRIKNNPRRLKF